MSRNWSRVTVTVSSPRNSAWLVTVNLAARAVASFRVEAETSFVAMEKLGEGRSERRLLRRKGFLRVDLALQTEEPLDQGLWAGRATRDVDVDRDEAINALQDGVAP